MFGTHGVRGSQRKQCSIEKASSESVASYCTDVQ